MPDIVDELGAALEDEIPRSDGASFFPLNPIELSNSQDWTPIVAFEVITKIVSRIGNRVFVGLPLCSPLLLLFITESYTQAEIKNTFNMSLTMQRP